MRRKNIDISKAAAIILYIAKELEKQNKSDLVTTFKVLYFAEQKHLVKYGRSIMEDRYIAMKNGPVPSVIYDCFKLLRDGGYKIQGFDEFYQSFACDQFSQITPLREPDLDLISKSEINCILESVIENGHLDFEAISKKSHDFAWENVPRDDSMNMLDIAKAGGANDEMLKYIQHKLDTYGL